MFKKIFGDSQKNSDKKKEFNNVWEEICQDHYKIKFSEINKLSVQELVESLKKYENFSSDQKKDLKKAENDRNVFKEKLENSLKERNTLSDLNEELQFSVIKY